MKKALFLLGLLFVANGMSHFLFGQNNGEPIVLEYQDYKFFEDEPDYKLLEVQVDNYGYAICESTQKFYVLDQQQNVIEYDLKNALNKDIKKRSFRLSFAPGMAGFDMSRIKISPNGQWLAFVDDGCDYLHIIEACSGKETQSYKLGKEFINVTDRLNAGCPFEFLSNSEILVSGTEKALVYNIDRKKGSSLKFEKKYRTIPKLNVSSKGTITGSVFDEKAGKYGAYVFWATHFVENGRIVNTIDNYAVYEKPSYIQYSNNGKHEYCNKRTGTRTEDFNEAIHDGNMNYCFSRIGNTIFLRFANLQGKSLISAQQQMVLKNYSLTFTKYSGGDFDKRGWLIDDKIMYMMDGYSLQGSNLAFFNHTLTDNEIAKQALLAAVNSNKIEDFDRFIADFGDSRYAKLAKQKRNDCVAKTSLQDAIAYLKNCSNPDYREAVENEVVTNKVKDLASATSCLDNYPQLSTKLENKMLGYVNSINDYETFVKYYPTKKASPELDDRLYQLVSQTYEENDLNYYLRVFPDGRHKSEATAEVNEIACYFAAKNGGKAECTTYLTKYPNGHYASEVQNRKEGFVKDEQRAAQLKVYSDKKNWKLGDKMCNCTSEGIIMATLDQWNEDRSSFKGIISASPGGLFQGDLLSKGNALWFKTSGWHKCLDDEIDYALSHDKSLEAEQLLKAKQMKFTRGSIVSHTYYSKGWFSRTSHRVTARVDDWNEDFTRMKIQIIKTGGLDYINGESIYEGKHLWVSPIDWE